MPIDLNNFPRPNRPTGDRLLNDEYLRFDETLVSADGKYKLAIEDSCDLVLRDNENRRVWRLGNTRPFGAYLRMQTDGNLVLCDTDDKMIWDSKTKGPIGRGLVGDKSATLIVKDGKVVIFSRGKDIWINGTKAPYPVPDPSPAPSHTATSGTSQPASGSTSTPSSTGTSQGTPTSVANPTTTSSSAVAPRPNLCVRGGQYMIINERIYSPSGKVWACFQDDCNFVVRTGSEVLYTANTYGKGIKTAILRTNGELSMSDKDQKQQWTSGSGSKEARDTVLLVQDDGHAVILSGGTRVWRTTCRKQTGFEGDRLNADEYLDVEQRINSPNGLYHIVLSGNGTFYLRETQGAQNYLWTNTSGALELRPGLAAKRITMRGDDDLWVGEGDTFSWSSTTCRRRDRTGNAALIVGDNGVGTIQVDDLVVWSSDPKKVPVSYSEAQQTTLLPTGRDRLRMGDYLPPKGTFWSMNGQFTGQLMENNNFNVYRKGNGGIWECLWSTKTSNMLVSKACLDWNGRFVLYGFGSKPVFETPTANSRGGQAELVLQNDGNLVLSRDGSAAWSTETSFPASSKTVDRIKWGEWLSIDQSLASQNSLYTLTLQDNANFCIKRKDTEPVYTNSAKSQTGARLVHFNRDSNDLEIYDNKGKPLGGFSGKKLWSATPGNVVGHEWHGESSFIIGDDGNAVLFLSGQILWESKNNGVPLLKGTAPSGGNQGRPG